MDLPGPGEPREESGGDEEVKFGWSSLAVLDLHRPAEEDDSSEGSLSDKLLVASSGGRGDSALREGVRAKAIVPRPRINVLQEYEDSDSDEGIMILGAARGFPSRENVSAITGATGGSRPDPEGGGVCCYWNNLGLIKQNAGRSLFGGPSVPDGLRPTMSMLDPERDAINAELAMRPVGPPPFSSLFEPSGYSRMTSSAQVHEVPESARTSVAPPSARTYLAPESARISAAPEPARTFEVPESTRRFVVSPTVQFSVVPESSVGSPSSRTSVRSPSARSSAASPPSRSSVKSPSSRTSVRSPSARSSVASPSSRSSVPSPSARSSVRSPSARSSVASSSSRTSAGSPSALPSPPPTGTKKNALSRATSRLAKIVRKKR